MINIRGKEQGVGHFEDFEAFEAFSLAASNFKYSLTSSTEVSSFFPLVPDVLF